MQQFVSLQVGLAPTSRNWRLLKTMKISSRINRDWITCAGLIEKLSRLIMVCKCVKEQVRQFVSLQVGLAPTSRNWRLLPTWKLRGVMNGV